jgi:SAM-dependent methyltransferase
MPANVSIDECIGRWDNRSVVLLPRVSVPKIFPPQRIKSYSSTPQGLRARLSELANLYTYQTQEMTAQVRTLIERVREAERAVVAAGGPPFKGIDLLEIGPGQRFRQMSYFARYTRAVGIDLDVLVQGAGPLSYLRMFKHNGPMRVFKTAGRRLLGIDRAFDREMSSQLGLSRPRRFNIARMDATQMTFPDQSFDVIYSYSVFEHIPDCRRVLEEIKRVLRPGGAMYISLHLYTSESGCHDPRIFSHKRKELPLWPHLRASSKHLVRPNAYLNEMRLHEWDALFESVLPGVVLERRQYGRYRLEKEIAPIRAAGELTEYSDDELLTTDYVAVWRKPG